MRRNETGSKKRERERVATKASEVMDSGKPFGNAVLMMMFWRWARARGRPLGGE
jgi:hypothetical protein